MNLTNLVTRNYDLRTREYAECLYASYQIEFILKFYQFQVWRLSFFKELNINQTIPPFQEPSLEKLHKIHLLHLSA